MQLRVVRGYRQNQAVVKGIFSFSHYYINLCPNSQHGHFFYIIILHIYVDCHRSNLKLNITESLQHY